MFDFHFPWKKYPAFWLEYLQCFKHNWTDRVAIDEVRFIVLDTETTGLDPSRDRILSIAAATVQGRQLLMADSFECFVAQPVSTGENAPVHGIMKKDMDGGLPEVEALRNLLKFCGNAVIVGHHVQFDLAMLNQALKRASAGHLKNRFLDTARLAMMVEHPFQAFTFTPKPGEFSLDALCERFHISPQERHTAPGDVYITAILFLKLLARVQKRGSRTLGELLHYEG